MVICVREDAVVFSGQVEFGGALSGAENVARAEGKSGGNPGKNEGAGHRGLLPNEPGA